MVQKGNPHQLPIRQHIFPAKSISRFCASTGGVEVHFLAQNSKRYLRPTDPPFVVKQSWDAKAEGHFKDIEDVFQAMVNNLNFTMPLDPNSLNQDAITRMFASWYARAYFEKIDNQKLKGMIGPSETLSEDEHEQLEKAGVVTVRGDCTIAGRQMAWPILLRQMDYIKRGLHGRQWGLFESKNGDFIVPDRPSKDMIALPLSPRRILVWGYPSQLIPLVTVKQINRVFLQCSHSYYFAQDIKKCPL